MPESFTSGLVVAGRTVDLRRRVLVDGDQEIRLGGKTTEVLRLLLERPGEVIAKDEFFERVWSGRAVSDDVLTVAIYRLRRAFGDRARESTVIETVSGVGYRWIGSVERLLAEAEAQRPRLDLLRREFLVASAVGLVAAGLGVLVWLCGAQGLWPLVDVADSPSSAASPPSVDLPTVPSLPVAPPAIEAYVAGLAALDLRSPKQDRIARSWLERSIEISPEFAEGHAGLARAWARRFDTSSGTDAAARERAKSTALRAVALDPGSSAARVALGEAHLQHWDLTEASQELQQALRLSPSSAVAHQLLALVRLLEGRHAEAEALARTAVSFEPLVGHHRLVLALVTLRAGRPAQTLATLEEATDLGALRGFGAFLAAEAHRSLGDEPRAVGAYLRFLADMDVHPTSLRRLRGAALGGLPALERAWLDDSAVRTTPAGRAILLLRVGRREEGRALVDALVERRDGSLLFFLGPPFLSDS